MSNEKGAAEPPRRLIEGQVNTPNEKKVADTGQSTELTVNTHPCNCVEVGDVFKVFHG